jgi:hypothetical protein
MINTKTKFIKIIKKYLNYLKKEKKQIVKKLNKNGLGVVEFLLTVGHW